MQVTVRSAKTNLSKLIAAALNGEDVVIARGDKPVVRLVPIRPCTFRIGILEGQLGTAPDFFEPMEEEERVLWEGGR